LSLHWTSLTSLLVARARPFLQILLALESQVRTCLFAIGGYVTRLSCVAMICLILASTPWVSARKHHHHDDLGVNFDYYLLSLSWAPNYCKNHPSDHSSECSGGHTAFVLHGLWPQSNGGLPPMSCSNGSPVAAATVDHMLNYMPTRALIQHEWQKHGTCSGLTAQDYFAKVEKAYKNVHVPDQYSKLGREQQFSVSDIEKNFADVNGAPPQAFRISCHAEDLVGVDVCLDKNLQYRACTQSVRECPVNQVDMRPPQ
jgi:ribonuclease T2